VFQTVTPDELKGLLTSSFGSSFPVNNWLGSLQVHFTLRILLLFSCVWYLSNCLKNMFICVILIIEVLIMVCTVILF